MDTYIVGDGNSSQISEEGDEDNELGTDGLVDDDHGGDEVKLKMETESNTVLDISLHTLENLASDLDGQDDGGETGGEEDDISGSLGSLSGTFDGDTTIGLLERGSVVDTVTSHGSQVTTLLQHLDDLVLVLGENLSETVGTLDEIVLSSARETTVDELSRVVDLSTESKHLASFLGDSNSVTSQHLDGDTELLSLNDGLSGIFTGRVEHREETKENPVAAILLVSDTKGTETTPSEIGSLVTEQPSGLLIAVGQVENSLGSSLGADVLVAAHVANRGDTLGDGVEGSELLSLPALVEDLASLGVAADGEESDLVNGVERLEVVGRSKGSDSHHPVDVLALSDVGLANGKLVGSESTGLVRAEDIDTSEGLDGSELLDDSALLGEVSSTDSKGGGGDDGKTDRDTDDEQDQSVVEEGDGALSSTARSSDTEVTEETTDPGSEDEEHDEDEESCTDRVHDSLEVTLILGSLDERGSATDEGVLGRSEGNTVGLAALATSGVVGDLTHVLVDSERLSGDGRLISGDEGVTLGDGALLVDVLVILLVIGVGRVVKEVLLLHLEVALEVLGSVVVADEADIGGDGLTLLDDDDITRNDFAGKNSNLTAVTDNGSLHSNVTTERGDDIGGLLLLVPTDESVEQENTADDTEIDPVAETGGEQSSEFHDVQNRALEVTEELLQEVGLLRGKLVVAEALATVLNLVGGDTLADIRVEHLESQVSMIAEAGGTNGDVNGSGKPGKRHCHQHGGRAGTYVVGHNSSVSEGAGIVVVGSPELPPRVLLLLGLGLELSSARVAVELDVLLQGRVLVHALEGGQRHNRL